MDAISGVGSTVIFQVDTGDAAYLKKDLQGLVELDDLIVQDVGHAVARIGNHVVRLQTHVPLEIPSENYGDQIVARSRRFYCRPRAVVQRAVRDRRQQSAGPLAPFGPDADHHDHAPGAHGPEPARDSLDDKASNYDQF